MLVINTLSGVSLNLERSKLILGDDCKVGFKLFVVFTSINKFNLTKLSALYTTQNFAILHDTCSRKAYAVVTRQQRAKCKQFSRSKNFKHVGCGAVNWVHWL